MPYIKEADREKFKPLIENLEGLCKTPGELNYFFTRIAHMYLNDNGLNYQKINDVIGALEGCKLELYRQHVAPYEDKKIEENGNV
jgi:hypothetical protein